MTFWAKFGFIMLALAVCAFGGWQARKWYDGAKQSKELEATLAALQTAQKKQNTIAGQYESERSKNSSLSAQLRQRLEVSRAKEPVAAGCVIPADGLRIVTEAVKAGRSR